MTRCLAGRRPPEQRIASTAGRRSVGHDRLATKDEDLASLIADLDTMERYLKKKITHLNELVDGVDGGWKSPAASVYKGLQQSVNEDAARIREMLILIEEAMKLSRNGFTAQELDIMHRFQQLQKTAEGRREIFAMADDNPPSTPADAPRSKLDDF